MTPEGALELNTLRYVDVACAANTEEGLTGRASHARSVTRLEGPLGRGAFAKMLTLVNRTRGAFHSKRPLPNRGFF